MGKNRYFGGKTSNLTTGTPPGWADRGVLGTRRGSKMGQNGQKISFSKITQKSVPPPHIWFLGIWGVFWAHTSPQNTHPAYLDLTPPGLPEGVKIAKFPPKLRYLGRQSDSSAREKKLPLSQRVDVVSAAQNWQKRHYEGKPPI